MWFQPGVETPAPPIVVGAPEPKTDAKPQPNLSVRPRFGKDPDVEITKPLSDGRTAIIITGGAALIISTPGNPPVTKPQIIDIEADYLVIWTKGNAQAMFNNMKSEQGSENADHELYMSGHVQMTRAARRTSRRCARTSCTTTCDAMLPWRGVDFEIMIPKALFPLHIRTPELQQLGPKLFSMKDSQVYSSWIPSDPGFYVNISNMTIEERKYELSYLYGLWPAYDKDGKRKEQTDHVFSGTNYLAYMEGVPVFYFPVSRRPGGGSAWAARRRQCRL